MSVPGIQSVDLEVLRGDALPLIVRLTDGKKAPLPILPSTELTWILRRKDLRKQKPEDTLVTLQNTAAGGGDSEIQTIDTAKSIILIKISDTHTLQDVGEYTHALRVVTSDGPFTALWGDFQIRNSPFSPQP